VHKRLQHESFIQKWRTKGNVRVAAELSCDMYFPQNGLGILLIETASWHPDTANHPKNFSNPNLASLAENLDFFAKQTAQQLIEKKKSVGTQISNLYVLVSLGSKQGMEDVYLLQNSLLNYGAFINILTYHTEGDLYETIEKLLKVTFAKAKDVIKDRFEQLLAAKCNISTPENNLVILSQIASPFRRLSAHECYVLHELNSIRSISLASKEEFLECSLDSMTSKAILSFFAVDSEI